MMRLISETDTPFDIATKELGYQREVLVTVPGANEGCPALTIYTRRSLLRLPDGRPLALHLECFTGANLKR